MAPVKTLLFFSPAGLTALLSPVSAKLFSSYSLPFPGHVLIYGPTVSFFQSLYSLYSSSMINYLAHHYLCNVVFLLTGELPYVKHPIVYEFLFYNLPLSFRTILIRQ